MTTTTKIRPARRYLRALLATFILAAATLMIAASLYGAARVANDVPTFNLQLPLLHGNTLEIGMVAGCPSAMSQIACLHIQDQFPQAFRVSYWSPSAASTLVSLTMPGR